MNSNQVQAFNRYEEIKLQIKGLEEEADGLKDVILPALDSNDKVQCASGGFISLQVRNSWKYSPPTKAMEDELKARKKQEEADGTAEALPMNILVYNSPKKEKAPTE